MQGRLSAMEIIRALSSELSAKQRKLVNFILQNMEKVAFMNSVDLAEAASVSNSTVIRLATRLGYSGFPDLQRALQQVLREQYSTLRRFSPDGRDTECSLVKQVFSLEYEVLREMQGRISEQKILEAVDLLRQSDEIYVIGLLANTCLAEYAAYFLGILRKKVNLITTPQHHIFN
nr:MurR/RpiR family transcriptional regulator [Synergistales bacterium]